MALSDLATLINATAQNTSQFKGLTAAYEFLGLGVPTIDGYTFLINENNNTNFGAGPGVTFNDENVYINTMNALYQGNATAKGVFDALVGGGATIQDKLAIVYNAIVPASAQTDAGRDFFISQSAFYTARAAELGIPGLDGAALVGAASLMKIVVDDDIGGFGDSINDLFAAVNNGTAALPQSGPDFTPLETADGTQFDGDDVSSSGGQLFTLTSGTDSFTGAATNDSFIANLINENGVANVQTLNNTDTLDGGAGTDSLIASYNTAVTPFSIKNIENITLTDADGGTEAINFVNVSGVSTLTSLASIADVNYDNLNSIVDLFLTNQNVDVDVDFLNSVVSGSSDTINLTLSSNTDGDVTIEGVETVAITSTGPAANVLDINDGAGTTLMTVTVAGSQDITLNDTTELEAEVTTVNASSLTGALSVDHSANAADVTITGGSGNDTIILGTTFNTNDTIDGGDGTDTLRVGEDEAIAIVAANSKVSNIEILDISETLAGNVNLTLFGASASGAPTTLELSAGIDASDRTLTVASGNTIDLEADAGDDITINVAGAGTSDSVTLILDDADVAANIQATTVETLNIVSTGTADGGENEVVGTTAVNTLAGTQSIIITGDEALTFSAPVTADVIDGSALTDVLTVDAGTTASAVVTGGSANDVLNVGDGNADIVNGGAGADNITFDIEVSDQLTGGDGNDVFQMDNDTDTTASGAVIADFTTNDELDLDESTIEALEVDGTTAIAQLTNMAGADVATGDLSFATVAADNTALATGDIVVLTGKTYANSAAALADIQTAGDRTFTANANYTDNDGVLLAYELTGGGVELAVVQQAGGASASSDTLDDIDVLVTLTGVTASGLSGFNIDLDA